MASKLLQTHVKEESDEICEIHVDYKEEMFYIKYYKNKDATGFFHLEEFPNKSLHYVEDAAINWCNGIKKIEEPMYGKTLFD
tara:strand:+ start:3471 stop:3716 length:246 start_codon:yes stop_codon:yes gene_type:complete